MLNRFIGVLHQGIDFLQTFNINISFFNFRTALAEAELEYNESHKSPSIYVRLEMKDIPQVPNLSGKRYTSSKFT